MGGSLSLCPQLPHCWGCKVTAQMDRTFPVHTTPLHRTTGASCLGVLSAVNVFSSQCPSRIRNNVFKCSSEFKQSMFSKIANCRQIHAQV